MRNKAICGHIKPDGSCCKATCLPASERCWFHDPSREQERAEGRRKGGKARNKPAVLPIETDDVPLGTVADVVTALATTFNEVRKGRLDPKTGNCLGLLAGQLLRAMQDGELAAEMEALAKEIQELKRANSNAPQTTEDLAGRSDGPTSTGDASDSTLAV